MGISDEIEAATTVFDEATILQIKAMIALRFQSSLTMLVVQWHGGKEMCQKVYCTFRVFLYLFSLFRRRYGTLSSLEALLLKKLFDFA